MKKNVLLRLNFHHLMLTRLLLRTNAFKMKPFIDYSAHVESSKFQTTLQQAFALFVESTLARRMVSGRE